MPTYYQLLRESLVPVSDEKLKRMKLYSRLLAALVAELPRLLGMGASSLLAITARRIGEEIACSEVENLNDALRCISRSTAWSMETYRVNGSTVDVIVRDCPIRQVCMFEGLPIGGTILCNIAKGLLEGFVKKSLNTAVKATPTATGPNACLYRVEARTGSRLPGASRFHIYRELSETSEEYAERVEKNLALLLERLAGLIERAAGPTAVAPLRLSSKRYGGPRARLYPRVGGMEEAVKLLAGETGLSLRVDGGNIVVEGCPLRSMNKTVLCESMRAFIEGFLSEAVGRPLHVSHAGSTGSTCMLAVRR